MRTVDPFAAFPDEIVLDGGLATELERRGADLRDELWSARLLLDDPDAIVDVHRAYVDAGADVVISGSYQASFDGFAARGLDRAAAAELMRRSVELARAATADAGRPVLVAASIGPYGAVLADGSEYTGDYGSGRAVRRASPRSESSTGRARRCSRRPSPTCSPSRRSRRSRKPRRSPTSCRRSAIPAWISFSCR